MHRRLTMAAARSGAVVLASTLGAAVPAAAATVSCGQVLTASITVTNDLDGCPGDGLEVGADGIVVDLNRHRIANGGGNGIDFQGHDRVTVRDGTIAGFAMGLNVDGDGNTVRAILATENDVGLAIDGGERNRILSSRISDNFTSGLLASGGRDNVIQAVRAPFNEFSGIVLAGGSGNRVVSSTGAGSNGTGIAVVRETSSSVTGSRAFGEVTGISVSESSDTTVSRSVAGARLDAAFDVRDSQGDGVTLLGNRTTGSGLDAAGFSVEGNQGAGDRVLANTARAYAVGILIRDATGTLVRDNVAGSRRGRSGRNDVLGNGLGIGVQGASSGVVLDGNSAHHNLGDGILIRETVADTVLRGNRTNFNQEDGISHLGTGATFTRNIAAYNTGIGLRAQPTDVDGGGNAAHHNDGGDCTSPPLAC